MKLESENVIKWYAATLGVSAGAVIYTYLGFGPVILGALAYAATSYLSLAALQRPHQANPPYQKLSEGIAVVGMVLFLPLVFMSGILVALMVFLGFAQLALNLLTLDYRRFYIGMLVSLICICLGATQAKTGFYLVFFLAYAVLAGTTFGYAYMAQRQDIGSAHWDWVDRSRVSLLLVGLALVLYLVLPRFPTGGLFAQPGSDHFYEDATWEAEARQNQSSPVSDLVEGLQAEDADSGEGSPSRHLASGKAGGASDSPGTGRQDEFDYKGFNDEFEISDPDAQGHRFSNRIVARMRADHPQYLRARIFDQFDGRRWRTSSTETVKVRVDFNGVDLDDADRYAASDLQSYEVLIEHDLGRYVPAAAVPVKLMFPATVIGIDRFGQIRSPGALRKGTTYAVTSARHIFEGRRFAELDHSPLPAYTQLPDDLDPRIAALADDVARGAASELAAAIALEHHLRSAYEYDLNAALASQGRTPLSEFLFEKRSGHCEYFASALAVMLRTRGIPSRLVTGFSATHRNPLTGYYDIYALDGHAWVEAFVDNLGWAILEPTAYYDGPQPEEQPLSAQQINDYVERQLKRKSTLGLDELTLEGVLNAAWQMLYVMVSAALAYVKLFLLTFWPWLVAASILGIGGWFAWRHYRQPLLALRLQRKVMAYPADRPEAAVAFYLSAIEDLLRLAGLQHPPGYTIERFLAAMSEVARVLPDPAMAEAFNRIFYNNDPGHPADTKNYKRLFLDLYRLGFGNLQIIAKKAGPSARGG